MRVARWIDYSRSLAQAIGERNKAGLEADHRRRLQVPAVKEELGTGQTLLQWKYRLKLEGNG